MQNQDLTSFILGASLERARSVLTEDLLLRLTPDEVRQLENALEQHAEVLPQLADVLRSHTSQKATS